MNYEILPYWDLTLGIVFKLGDLSNQSLTGLIYDGVKLTSGAPAATAGRFTKGCQIKNIADGRTYVNSGTTASPVWTFFETASGGFVLPLAVSDGTTTTGTSFGITFSTLTSGVGQKLTGPGAGLLAAGIIQDILMGAATTGHGQVISTTGIYTGLNGIWNLIANAATTGTIGRIDGTGLTTGNGLYILGGGANMAAGGNVANFDMGAGVDGSAVLAQTSGIYVGTSGVSRVVAALATTGHISVVSAPGITSGIINEAIAAAATMTTGRYYSANDGATEVFGIGANGHIHSKVSASGPSILITAAHGITAVALTPGSTDTCGGITSTGTQDNTTDSTFTLTFGKTYTTAPKSVQLTALNAAGAVGSSLPYIVSITATAVVFGITKSAAAAATPSWMYTIIA